MDLAMVYEDYDWTDEQTEISIYTDNTEETVTFPIKIIFYNYLNCFCYKNIIFAF